MKRKKRRAEDYAQARVFERQTIKIKEMGEVDELDRQNSQHQNSIPALLWTDRCYLAPASVIEDVRL
jgi:hypothetical protein